MSLHWILAICMEGWNGGRSKSGLLYYYRLSSLLNCSLVMVYAIIDLPDKFRLYFLKRPSQRTGILIYNCGSNHLLLLGKMNMLCRILLIVTFIEDVNYSISNIYRSKCSKFVNELQKLIKTCGVSLFFCLEKLIPELV